VVRCRGKSPFHTVQWSPSGGPFRPLQSDLEYLPQRIASARVIANELIEGGQAKETLKWRLSTIGLSTA
jgi:hypothetical protein